VAGLVAGAVSMALGEYVSVSVAVLDRPRQRHSTLVGMLFGPTCLDPTDALVEPAGRAAHRYRQRSVHRP